MKYEQTEMTSAQGVTLDKWIIGEGADTDVEYLIHAERPRFIAKVAIEMEGEEVLSAVSYEGENGTLHDFVWIDPPPSDHDALLTLFGDADRAITRDSQK